MKQSISQSFLGAIDLIQNFIRNDENIEKINVCAGKFAEKFSKKHKILICGNGGSACDAMHFAEEFTGRYRQNRRALPVISLTDPSHITCVGNDFGFDQIFSRGVEAYGQEGDVFIGLSTSGNSKNVLNAIQEAKRLKMMTVALLGKDGGDMKGLCDVEWIIPGQTADRIQEVHMMILHILIESVERILFPEHY